MLCDQLGQGTDAKLAWLEVAAEPQNAEEHLWAFVEVYMGLPDSSFIRCLLHMEKHFVLVTGILTVSVFHYSIANELLA